MSKPPNADCMEYRVVEQLLRVLLNSDEPVRILNIDAIPPETVESIKDQAAKLFGGPAQTTTTKFKGDVHHG